MDKGAAPWRSNIKCNKDSPSKGLPGAKDSSSTRKALREVKAPPAKVVVHNYDENLRELSSNNHSFGK